MRHQRQHPGIVGGKSEHLLIDSARLRVHPRLLVSARQIDHANRVSGVQFERLLGHLDRQIELSVLIVGLSQRGG